MPDLNPLSTVCADTKRLLKKLLSPNPLVERSLSIDQIEPAVKRESEINPLVSAQLLRSVSEPSYSTKTTYAKPCYFTHIAYKEKTLPYLIKERLPDEPIQMDVPQLLFGATFQLDPTGIIKQTAAGLVYLDISDDYIHQLYPFFQPYGAEKPYYAAHIPVISEEEASTIACSDLPEIGERFTFTVKNCQKIVPKHSPETEAIWILNVESSSLMLLREHYKLSSKLHSQDFAIVIAIKHKKTESPSEERECHYVKINPASFYA